MAESIKNIVLTSTYERFFAPEFGGNINALLFENWSSIVQSEIENRISTSIRNYEPRANILDVKAEDNSSRNQIDVTVVFRTNTTTQDAKVNIALKRIF